MAFCEELGCSAGLAELKLDATLNAAPFYRRCGFVGDVTGIYRSPRGVSLDCIPMTNRISPPAHVAEPGNSRPSSGSTMRYRSGTAADALVLAQMNHQLIRDEGHRNRMSMSELEDRLRSWLEGEYQAVLFEDDKGTAGYVLYRWEPEWVYVRQYFVRPERRRQGIGRTAWAWLQDNSWRDAPRIRLDVLVGNASGLQFWRSLGFADYCVTMERANRS